jgi:hypothetical protein
MLCGEIWDSFQGITGRRTGGDICEIPFSIKCLLLGVALARLCVRAAALVPVALEFHSPTVEIVNKGLVSLGVRRVREILGVWCILQVNIKADIAPQMIELGEA